MAFGSAEVGVVNKVLWLVAHHRRRAARWLVDAAHRPVARAVRLWCAADACPTSASGGWRWSGKGATAGSFGLPAFDWVLRQAHTSSHAGRRGAAARGGLGQPLRRHGHGGLPRLPDERCATSASPLPSSRCCPPLPRSGRVWVGPLAGVLAESIGWPGLLHHQHGAGGAGLAGCCGGMSVHRAGAGHVARRRLDRLSLHLEPQARCLLTA